MAEGFTDCSPQVGKPGGPGRSSRGPSPPRPHCSHKAWQGSPEGVGWGGGARGTLLLPCQGGGCLLTLLPPKLTLQKKAPGSYEKERAPEKPGAVACRMPAEPPLQRGRGDEGAKPLEVGGGKRDLKGPAWKGKGKVLGPHASLFPAPEAAWCPAEQILLLPSLPQGFLPPSPLWRSSVRPCGG